MHIKCLKLQIACLDTLSPSKVLSCNLVIYLALRECTHMRVKVAGKRIKSAKDNSRGDVRVVSLDVS